MTIHTKSLFDSLIKAIECDLLLDVGSRDGADAISFRRLLPEAIILAFEANPIAFDIMKKDARLTENRISIFPYAVSNSCQSVTFNIVDADYSKPQSDENQTGSSSLLLHPTLNIMKSVSVDAIRLDKFLCGNSYSVYKKIGLWIDVEGAEFFVIEGIEKIKDRIKVIHVETAIKPKRHGQIVFEELTELMEKYDFSFLGSNIGGNRDWGDAVFINNNTLEDFGWRIKEYQSKASLCKIIKIDIIGRLSRRYPRVYRYLRGRFGPFP